MNAVQRYWFDAKKGTIANEMSEQGWKECQTTSLLRMMEVAGDAFNPRRPPEEVKMLHARMVASLAQTAAKMAGKEIDLANFLQLCRYAFPYFGLRGAIAEVTGYDTWKHSASHADDGEGWMLPFAKVVLSSSDLAIFIAIIDGTIYQREADRRARIVHTYDMWAAMNPSINNRIKMANHLGNVITDESATYSDVEYLERIWLGMGGRSVKIFGIKRAFSRFTLADPAASEMVFEGQMFDYELYPYFCALNQGATFPLIALSFYDFEEIARIL